MKFIIYSYKQPDICKIITEKLHQEGYEGTWYSDSLKLKEDYKLMLHKPDILILDYQSFNHELYTINSPSQNEKIDIPIIYYNDPCPSSFSLASHWIYQTIRFYKSKKMDTPYDYIRILSDLEDIVLDKDLMPYINLLCQPKSLASDNDISYKQELKLPKNIEFLFDYFISHKGKKITIYDIQNYYSENFKTISETSLKVLISNLRKHLENLTETDLYICKKRDYYKLIEL